VRAGHQHLGDAVERIAGLVEEFVFRPHRAAMLCSVMGMRAALLHQNMLGVEPQHLGGLVVSSDRGMEEAHVKGFIS
jgi:hypothetical protein